jgi:hypothetical protein
MNITSNGCPWKSSLETVRPSTTFDNEKTGISVPNGSIVEAVRTILSISFCD